MGKTRSPTAPKIPPLMDTALEFSLSSSSSFEKLPFSSNRTHPHHLHPGGTASHYTPSHPQTPSHPHTSYSPPTSPQPSHQSPRAALTGTYHYPHPGNENRRHVSDILSSITSVWKGCSSGGQSQSSDTTSGSMPSSSLSRKYIDNEVSFAFTTSESSAIRSAASPWATIRKRSRVPKRCSFYRRLFSLRSTRNSKVRSVIPKRHNIGVCGVAPRRLECSRRPEARLITLFDEVSRDSARRTDRSRREDQAKGATSTCEHETVCATRRGLTFDGKDAETLHVPAAVPQAYPLSPILFILFTTPLSRLLEKQEGIIGIWYATTQTY